MNLIYQYWDGIVKPSAVAGSSNMKRYAKKIDSAYLFERNPKYFKNAPLPHYGAFKPVFDKSFDKYENILFVDTDVFAKHNLNENIFYNFKGDIGMCSEPLQPKIRNTRSDGNSNIKTEKIFSEIVEYYGGSQIKDNDGFNKVFNSGVVLYSKKGREKARKYFDKFNQYYNLARNKGLGGVYLTDQNYLQAMALIPHFDFQELDPEWNSCITWAPKSRDYIIDSRTDKTKFVHIQMRGADNLSATQLEVITNRPVEEWGNDHQGRRFKTIT